MMTDGRRISWLSALAAVVLVLLPILAWLQYSWLDQIADADRDRRGRVLQTAATQLAQDVDSEIGKAAFALQVDAAMVDARAWDAFADKYQTWAASALSVDIVDAVYFVAAPAGAPPQSDVAAGNDVLPISVWNAQARTFESIAWPPSLRSIRERFARDGSMAMNLQIAASRRDDRGGDRRQGHQRDELLARGLSRVLLPPAPQGDAQSIVMPVLRITTADGGRDDGAGPPDVKLVGFTIVHLDLNAIGRELLPSLVRRHLYGSDEETDYHIAVLSRDEPAQAIFESQPGAAAIATANPDITTPLFGPRMGPLMFMARGDGRRPRGEAGREPGSASFVGRPPPPPPPPPTQDVTVSVVEARRRDGEVTMRSSFGDGHWRLVAKHRAGSLEAAVAATRTRNFVLSSSILALLAAAIGLIVVSARRADRLARQQLEFVAAVSHELRTPVSVIGAAAGNLADGVVGEPQRVRKYGATIQTEARRLAETVERVLQLAGIASGRAPASTVIAAQRLIDEALAAVRHEIEAAAVSIEMEIADPLPPVEGDAMALRSALQNLIGNALKYSGDARWLRISAAVRGETVAFSVADRGLGIAAADRKHIFEPFYRGRDAVARQIQGSGLGLHLVRRIVEAHGGQVTVDSEPGAGSTFTMTLPIASPERAAGAPDGAPVPAAS